jgi:hypothetical protein
MNGSFKKFLKRLLSLKNIVPLLVIVIAFAATFISNPFGLQLDQVILALLAFLAIDSLVERLETLHGIEMNVKRMRELAESRSSEGNLLGHREDFLQLEQSIADAKEIWMTGITFQTMAMRTELFLQKAEEGARFRFLGVAPDGDHVKEMERYFGYAEAELTALIRVNLGRLHNRLVCNLAQKVELRIIPHRLACGYFIVDPHTDQGYMTVTAYFCQTQETFRSPVMFLSKRTDLQWFMTYLDDFNRLWDSAVEWAPDQ